MCLSLYIYIFMGMLRFVKGACRQLDSNPFARGFRLEAIAHLILERMCVFVLKSLDLEMVCNPFQFQKTINLEKNAHFEYHATLKTKPRIHCLFFTKHSNAMPGNAGKLDLSNQFSVHPNRPIL